MVIAISVENSVFDGDPGAEVARILRKLAKQIADGDLSARTIQDANGNTIGSFRP